MRSFETSPLLLELGFGPFFESQTLALDPLRFSLSGDTSVAGALAVRPERVTSQRRSDYVVSGDGGSRRAVLSGRLHHELPRDRYPGVGDWVLASAEDPGRIEHVFDRKTAFVRKAVGRTSEEQCIAANVELSLLVAAVSAADADPHRAAHELSITRLQRYVDASARAQVRPLVVLNKADLNEASRELTRATESALGGVDVIAVSATSGMGMEELAARIGRGQTAVLVGSSGVGKSSLTNRLLGRVAQVTSAVREGDGRGRHTTTGRELFVLPTGGVLIDTPGMREFGLVADEDAGPAAFDDVEALGEGCRFSDCRHEEEPGCAVQAAVAAGTLSAERVAEARKLGRELRSQRSRTDALARVQTKQRSKAATRQLRERLVTKGRR